MKPFLMKSDDYNFDTTSYDLVGVVEHMRTQGGDMYRTIVRNQKNKIFYIFQDEKFRPVEAKTLG